MLKTKILKTKSLKNIIATSVSLSIFVLSANAFAQSVSVSSSSLSVSSSNGTAITSISNRSNGSNSAAKSIFERDRGGAVYVMANQPEGNEILVFRRNTQGELTFFRSLTTATQGLGGGNNAPADPLGSQGSLTFDLQSNALIAVNAGDDSISVIDVGRTGLKLNVTHKVSSGGNIPVSTAVSEGMVYVLNAGGEGIVTTFELEDGKLLERSRMSLGLSNSETIPFNNVFAPGQVGVDALNRHLMVVNASGQEMLTVDLDENGVPVGSFTSTTTPGVVPFAFATTRFGATLVAEAGSGAVTSFDFPQLDNSLSPISSLVSTGQAAACWVVLHDNGFAYVSNTASNTISSFTVDRVGQVALLESVAGETEASPTDMAFANDQGFLYSVDAIAGVISAFKVNEQTGELSLVEQEAGLPAALGIQGIASFDR
ncbi:lactonase family protein [Glaciecola sp. SC05]|uniref:lactonase family protein n=1 Tax=Glaciecola sp. SC05 TaxID=1987355 RepID=UPI003528B7D0